MREPVGVVPLEGRGSLPFADLHGEPLFLHALRALARIGPLAGRLVVTAEADQVKVAAEAVRRSGVAAAVEDARAWWAALPRDEPVTVVAHDPLCPLTSADFLASCLEEAQVLAESAVPGFDGRSFGGSLVAYRPVTDTLKAVVEDRIVDTLDRERFGVVASPVVFTLGSSGEPATPPPTRDFAGLAGWLRARGPVELRRAPSLGRRVDDPSAVNLLACMDEMARTVQEI